MKPTTLPISEIKTAINKSVLCWLATTCKENIPNVSPKEAFKFYGERSIIIANIASPKSIRNIRENENVCVSFIDILVQKGFQIKGKASIMDKKHPEYEVIRNELLALIGDKYPFSSVTKIEIVSAKPIIAPSYILYPEITEAEQVESAKRAYGMG